MVHLFIPVGSIVKALKKDQQQQHVPVVYQVPAGQDASGLISNEQLPDGAPPPYPGNQPMQPQYLLRKSKLSSGSKALISVVSVLIGLLVIGLSAYFIWISVPAKNTSYGYEAEIPTVDIPTWDFTTQVPVWYSTAVRSTIPRRPTTAWHFDPLWRNYYDDTTTTVPWWLRFK